VCSPVRRVCVNGVSRSGSGSTADRTQITTWSVPVVTHSVVWSVSRCCWPLDRESTTRTDHLSTPPPCHPWIRPFNYRRPYRGFREVPADLVPAVTVTNRRQVNRCVWRVLYILLLAKYSSAYRLHIESGSYHAVAVLCIDTCDVVDYSCKLVG